MPPRTRVNGAFLGLSRAPLAALSGVAALLITSPARAADPFEIQVYDGSTNDPGTASMELHANTRRAPDRAADPPELPSHKQSHFTFEPALGVTRFWEVGAYLQFAARADDTFYWAGIKLRSKLVMPEGFHPHLRLGFNVEIAAIPERFEADRFGGELRPIVAWDDRYFHLAANPNLEVSLAGAGLSAGPELSPGLAAYAKIPDVIEVGGEYYGSIGPIAHVPVTSAQEHYVFLAGNVLALAGWELNFGVGAGLTASSDKVVVKAIFGHDLGQLWGKAARSARRAGAVAAR
ncbi:MAG: hypothetical protein U0359_13790 [Byssovorax sp.]